MYLVQVLYVNLIGVVLSHNRQPTPFTRNNEPWKYVSPKVEFQPSEFGSNQPHASKAAIKRFLGDSKDASSTGSAYSFYGNMDDDLSSYQLSWRLLGFYIDCGYDGDDYDGNRMLGSDDANGCQRIVLYGVYLDPGYEGNGFYEYEYYSIYNDDWQCYGDNCRQKMDCHLPDTNWQLVGVFRINNVSYEDGWMEQLFKHEGVCISSEDDYYTTYYGREYFPYTCQETGEVDSSGNALYYHSKPEKHGNYTIGLYTDSSCAREYTGTEFDPFTLSGIDKDFVDEFNSAMNIFKVCQPCLAYDVSEDDFYCYDTAGYENCDQCMKFGTKAYSHAATLSDITLASRQQTVLAFEINGQTVGNGGIGRSDNNEVEELTSKLQSGYGVMEWIDHLFEENNEAQTAYSRDSEFPFIPSVVFLCLGLLFYFFMYIGDGKFFFENEDESSKTSPLLDDKINLEEDSIKKSSANGTAINFRLIMGFFSDVTNLFYSFIVEKLGCILKSKEVDEYPVTSENPSNESEKSMNFTDNMEVELDNSDINYINENITGDMKDEGQNWDKDDNVIIKDLQSAKKDENVSVVDLVDISNNFHGVLNKETMEGSPSQTEQNNLQGDAVKCSNSIEDATKSKEKGETSVFGKLKDVGRALRSKSPVGKEDARNSSGRFSPLKKNQWENDISDENFQHGTMYDKKCELSREMHRTSSQKKIYIKPSLKGSRNPSPKKINKSQDKEKEKGLESVSPLNRKRSKSIPKESFDQIKSRGIQ